MKKKNSLLFRFGVLFAVFTIVTLILSGVTTFINQTNIYREQREASAKNVALYLEHVIQSDGEDFIDYQNYFLEHRDEMKVPLDFSDTEEARENFEVMLAAKYPGKVLGKTIFFDDLDPETQNAYAVYNHEYYLLAFEQASEDFGLIYTYYTVPVEGDHMVCFVLDALREPSEDDPACIYLGIEAEQVPENHEKQWEAWETGKSADGFDVFDNEYGKTYAYYTPLYVNGQKLGVIGTEVEIADVNRGILKNTVKELWGIAAVLIASVIIMMLVINKVYIKKIESYADNVRKYAENKDASIAGDIERAATGKDELAALGNQTAAMILELDNYMKNLVETTRELSETKEEANAMKELAHKDSLTGVGNKTAYDAEIKHLEWELDNGNAQFGFAMVDLNYLKRINDTYGHSQGNEAIKRCCKMVCDVFKHSPVFRIGGDEFVIILKGRDYENIDELVKNFKKIIDQNDTDTEPWKNISAAIGYAKYDNSKDNTVLNVFKRADKAMYAQKSAMKANRR